jgi:hypothetical protein
MLGECDLYQHGRQPHLRLQQRLFGRRPHLHGRQRVPHDQRRLLGECDLREHCRQSHLCLQCRLLRRWTRLHGLVADLMQRRFPIYGWEFDDQQQLHGLRCRHLSAEQQLDRDELHGLHRIVQLGNL